MSLSFAPWRLDALADTSMTCTDPAGRRQARRRRSAAWLGPSVNDGNAVSRFTGCAVRRLGAFSQARKLLGEQVVQRLFELDAAVADADLGIGLLWKGLEVTAIDGTTMELARNGVLDGEFGTPADGARPLLRVTAHVRTATFRWIGAAIGGYHDGENALADQLEGSFRPGMPNLADRGFFSMDRFLRFSGTGAHLAWRVKDGAKSVPSRPYPTAPSWPCCMNRTACAPGAGAAPGTRGRARR